MIKKVLAIIIILHTFISIVYTQTLYSSSNTLGLENNSKISVENFNTDLLLKYVLQKTNQHRKNKNKKALKYNDKLEAAALIHSEEMNKLDFFDHVNRRNKTFRYLENRVEYVSYSPYIEIAENIYNSYIYLAQLPTYEEMAIEITNAFIESKSHNLNLIDKNLKEIGMMIVFEDKQEQGYLYYYFTQDFGSR